MTLQQLKYAVTVAECGTISAAAEKLFISQPSLTTAIRELESEMGVTIFSRTNRGVIVSREGEEFLGYARQILSQAQLLQERFSGREQGEKRFAVSSTLTLRCWPFPGWCRIFGGPGTASIFGRPLPMRCWRM